MKALLLKDWYMLCRYCRTYLLVTLVFFGASFASGTMAFCRYYPCVLAGMLPITLISYDERSGFDRGCAALPVTKKKLVSEKYLLCIILILAMWLLSIALSAVQLRREDAPSADAIRGEAALIFACAMLSPTVSMPFVFRFGAEKGRFSTLILIGALGGAGALLMTGPGDAPTLTGGPIMLLIPVCLALYAASWRLSVGLYEKREV